MSEQKWIDRNEKLPKVGELVLVRTDSFKNFGDICCARLGEYGFRSVPGAYQLSDVIQWAAIPDADLAEAKP